MLLRAMLREALRNSYEGERSGAQPEKGLLIEGFHARAASELGNQRRTGQLTPAPARRTPRSTLPRVPPRAMRHGAPPHRSARRAASGGKVTSCGPISAWQWLHVTTAPRRPPQGL